METTDEALEITYSYWDGAGHRRVMQVRKEDTIGEFLRAVQQQVASEFREIDTTSVQFLLYVKEDLIIPHSQLLTSKGQSTQVSYLDADGLFREWKIWTHLLDQSTEGF
ncbi:hypothetical protein L2E82_27756 [Cichorium intybus]|uniref:Uncharacterized protein n=1 Tax=Cichorium intybus TaxID=13427 RepID=A0ACB9CTT5_CICIN|nr:hypothetical protein L2E82_27756 [Cichorium intybus]